MEMRWCAIAFLSAMTVGAVGAHAADKTPGEVYDWKGLYFGVNLGYGLSPSTGHLDSYSAGYAAAAAAGGTPSSLRTKAAGMLGGAQFGNNWQFGSVILGDEYDIQASGVDDTSTVSFAGGGGILPSTSTGEEKLRWFGTVRLRAGFLIIPRALLYATGGFAYGGVSDRATNVFAPTTAGNAAGSSSGIKIGWTVGGGVEWALTNSWALRGEYLYVDLGNTTVRINDPVNFPGVYAYYNFKHRYHIGRVGLSYKF